MVENFDLRLLNVGYDNNWQDWQWKDVCSPFARIYLVTKGSATVYMEDKSLELTPGHLYLIPPFKKHTCVGKEGFSHYYMHLYEWPEAGFSIFNEVKLDYETLSKPGDKEIFQMLICIFPESRLNDTDPKSYDNEDGLRRFCLNFRERQPSEKLLAKGAMLMLMSRFCTLEDDKTNRNPKIAKVCGYINAHIVNELSVAQLAEIACMSESHFMRMFKKEMKMTPAQYIIQRRIQNAQLFLLLRNEPVKNIAASVGFFDASHFVKTFRKITGFTPQEFRSRANKEFNF